MPPMGRGRHCAVCDKVVRDFEYSNAEEIKAEIENGSVHCGRFSSKAMALQPLAIQAFAKIPLAYLKKVVFALTLVFGLEAWGISHAQAQTLQPAVDALRFQDNLAAALQDTSNELRIVGTIQDVYTRESVMHASVVLYHRGEPIQGTLSNSEGKFELVVQKDDLSEGVFDLHLSYLGKTREDKGIKADFHEFLYLIDASQFLPTVEIEGRANSMILGELVYVGILNPAIGEDRQIYRPLDEWLMMNFSEIHHDGRW